MQRIEDCHSITAISSEKILENIKFNTDKYREFADSDDYRSNKAIALVAGGPSLKTQLKKLTEFSTIVVCGSAHDYLVDQGIVPTYCMVCDPDPIVIEYLKLKQPEIKYLIASQCDPKVFKHLKDYDLQIWHCFGDIYPRETWGADKTLIGGGATIGTRALVAAIGMGYQHIHLFGYDNCITNLNEHHAYDYINPGVESIGNVVEISLGDPSGKKYHVPGFLLAQLMDFQKLLKMYANRISITVHGEGLIKDLMEMSKGITLGNNQNG